MLLLAVLASLSVAAQTVRVPTGQRVATEGSLELSARPLDQVIGGDGRIYVKTNGGLVVVKDGAILQRLSLPGASMKGIVLAPEGDRLYVSDAASAIQVVDVGKDALSLGTPLPMLEPRVKGSAYPCGMALLGDGRLVIASSRGNEVQVLDPTGQRQPIRIPVDVAPYDVKLVEGIALVTCWSVQPSRRGRKAPSSDTPVPVTSNGIATQGSLLFVDLAQQKVVSRIKLGRQPTDIALGRDGIAYVAESNSDTVAVVDLRRRRIVRRLTFSERLHGLAPHALGLSPQRDRLYVSLGGVNEVAVFDLTRDKERLVALLPTQWYPGPVTESEGRLLVGCLKGTGQGPKPPDAKGYNVYQYSGTLQWLQVPLSHDAVVTTPTLERRAPLPPFEHVVYILKENRTYDQVLGDMPKGDGDPSLTLYGQNVTPNTHALADEYVLLDNYYCNGVNSADGHAWSVEGNVTPYFERSFGGWTRSYPFGDDPLSVSASGFLWDSVLDAGKTFRNFGEFDYADTDPTSKTWTDVFRDRTIKLTHNIGVEKVRKLSNPAYPGWNLKINDQLRADIFLKEFASLSKMPDMTFIYLPQDHTSGLQEGMPTPRAMNADNDYSLGRIVDAISHSKFWPKTCIFVIEDDPQDGFDHVDGHRSLCLVISPYTLRGAVVKDFYNQTSVLHTMNQILGIPPRTIHVANSPVMSTCFQREPNLTPFTCKPNLVPFDEMNPASHALTGSRREMAQLSANLDFTGPDRAEEDVLNRVLWFAAKGERLPYPEALAGAHGKGLSKRGLKSMGN